MPKKKQVVSVTNQPSISVDAQPVDSLGNFVNAPVEILLYILSYLHPRDLCVVSQLSHAFEAHASCDDLWKRFLEPIFNTQRVDDILKENQIQLTGKHSSYPAKTLVKRFSSFSIFGQSANLQNTLCELEETESQLGVSSQLSTQYLNQLSEAGKLEKKKFGFIKYGKPKVNMEKLGDAIKSAKALHFDKLKEIADFVDEKKNSMDDFSYRTTWACLYSTIVKIINTHRENASIVKYPECLQKILDYIKRTPTPTNTHLLLLADVLNNPKLIQHPELPQIIDAWVEYTNNPINRKKISESVVKGEDVGEIIVNILLDRFESRHKMSIA